MEIEAAMTNKTPQFNEPNMRIVKSAGFGAQLRAARETMSLTEKDAAARLHLSPKIIQIMEEENFENGPPATFIRGYLRSYARMLCISEEMIHTAVARLESAIPQTPHPSAPPILKTQSSNQTHHYLRLMTYVVIAALLVLMSLWWTSHPKDILTAAKTTAIVKNSTVPAPQAPVATQPAPVVTQTAPVATAVLNNVKPKPLETSPSTPSAPSVAVPTAPLNNAETNAATEPAQPEAKLTDVGMANPEPGLEQNENSDSGNSSDDNNNDVY